MNKVLTTIFLFITQLSFAQIDSVSLESIDDQTVTIFNDSTTLYVFHLWSIDSEKELNEIHKLNQLTNKFKDTKVIFISATPNSKEKVKEYIEGKPFNYLLFAGVDGKRVNKLFKNHGIVRRYPTHIITNGYGKIIKNAVGSCVTVHQLILSAIENQTN